MTDTRPTEQPTRAERLTSTAQVLDVLRAGGSITVIQAHDVDPRQHAILHDATGAALGAWLNAITAALKHCEITDRSTTAGIRETWRLPPARRPQ
jgi:hypothetical protein